MSNKDELKKATVEYDKEHIKKAKMWVWLQDKKSDKKSDKGSGTKDKSRLNRPKPDSLK